MNLKFDLIGDFRLSAPVGAGGTFYLHRVKKKIIPCKINKLNPLPVSAHTCPAGFVLAFVSLFGES